MGFVSAHRASTGTPPSEMISIFRSGTLTAGNPQTCNLPDEVRDGDLVFAWFISNNNPTTAWSTPSGWTSAMTQKNGSSSFGGRSALFKKVWRDGDPTTVSSSGPGGECHTICIAVRSDTDGASLSVGTITENEGTVAGTTLVMPQMNVSSKYDFRLWFQQNTSGSPVATPPSVTANADNPFSVAPAGLCGVGVSGAGCDVHSSVASDTAGTEAGNTNWTILSGKYYCFCFAVNDPTATENGMAIGTERYLEGGVVPTPAFGVDHESIAGSIAVPSIGAGSVELF